VYSRQLSELNKNGQAIKTHQFLIFSKLGIDQFALNGPSQFGVFSGTHGSDVWVRVLESPLVQVDCSHITYVSEREKESVITALLQMAVTQWLLRTLPTKELHLTQKRADNDRL